METVLQLLHSLCPIYQHAATTLAELSKTIESFDTKDDGSPVCIGDIAIEEYLRRELPGVVDAPVFGEESCPAWEQRQGVEDFWYVDPLDGTKNFLAGSNEYSIVISLLRDRKPYLGSIIVPAEGLLYFAVAGHGAYRFDINAHCETLGPYRLPVRCECDRQLRMIVNRNMSEESRAELHRFLEAHAGASIFVNPIGSALKAGRLAEGSGDLILAVGKTYEWDVAGPCCILQELGFTLTQWADGRPLRFNETPETCIDGYLAVRSGSAIRCRSRAELVALEAEAANGAKRKRPADEHP